MTNLTTNPTATLFEQIAKQHLSINTLVEQHSDGLDFHDVSVIGVRRALEAAYKAGQQGVAKTLPTRSTPAPQTATGQYDACDKRIDALLDRLNAARIAHAERAAGQAHNWGFVGSLGAFEQSLTEALELIVG